MIKMIKTFNTIQENLMEATFITNNKKEKYYFSNNNFLKKILEKCEIATIHNQWKINVKFIDSYGKETSMSLGRLAYCVYHYGVTLENMSHKLVEIRNYFDINGLEIDHLNTDRRNYCEYNLLEMKGTINNHKKDLSARIKKPYFLYLAVDEDKECRLYFGYKSISGFNEEHYFLCKSPDLLLDCLRKIFNLKIKPTFQPSLKLVKEVWHRDEKAEYFGQDINKSTQMADKLLSMDKNEFRIWTFDSEFAKKGGFILNVSDK